MKEGDQFGRLTVVRVGGSYASCHCECGTEKEINKGSLRSGRTASCGCLNSELASERMAAQKTTHGMSRSSEYQVWGALVQRCTNPNNPNYPKYGGRGITVNPLWVESFEAFFQEIGARPSMQHSVDRIDNGQGYEPGNVRWATRSEQQRNTRRNRLLTLGDKTQCMSAWAEELGISRKTLHMRLSRGWSAERTLTQPLEAQKHNAS
ncbi:MAG: hypothetical protein DRQ64_00265 [Gammaproteobacteria bacterium]|nr:MAG: hypothetical protein DRQ64_00265 [Gammaproteobacteria bacterium]